VPGKFIGMMSGPFEQILFAVVMGHQSDALLFSHQSLSVDSKMEITVLQNVS
jgi:hypothetical protein